MERIFVRFPGDNDFCNTVQAFVKILAPRILAPRSLQGRWGGRLEKAWGEITKTRIAELFNETAPALYKLHQAHSPHDTAPEGYLKITEADVFVDDEFDDIPPGMYNHDGCLAFLVWVDRGEGEREIEISYCRV
jgi:hypothetical protein